VTSLDEGGDLEKWQAVNVWSGEVRCNEMMPCNDGDRLDTASFWTPSPLAIKDRKVGGLWDLLLTLGLNKARSTIVPNEFFNHHVRSPPTVKSRMVEGVQNILWTVQLHNGGITVYLSTHFNNFFGPPPLDIEGRKVGGSENSSEP
jgi:hypothetical protein